MKILIIHGGEIKCPGGVYKTVRETAKYLAEMGHDVVLLQENPSNLSKEEYYEGFNVVRVKNRFDLYGLNIQIYFYLKNHFKDLNPDVIHVHGYHSLFSVEIIYLVKKIDPNIPIVFSPHFGILSHNTLAGKYLSGTYNNIIGKKNINLVDKIIAASEFEAKNVIGLLNVPESKLTIIPHGVDKIDVIKKQDLDGPIHLLYVGHLLKLKGVQYIINALYELVHQKNIKVYLTVVGDGPYKKKLKKIAENYNVDKYIKWEGFVSSSNTKKLLNYYKDADMLLLLSQSENYGIVVSESLAMGTPVIVTKTTALNEFLDEVGCFGVSYPPNPKEVADAVLNILDNYSVGPFSEKIRTWSKVAKDYEQIYLNLLGDL
ncbi:glycosyltransferase family 4 protein [Methanobacterium sp.]|uniref:glycosyltransferase family 4 protein n=1 Tax=Methanobacterium sp. TaxID=2164 RepID=UPI002AB84BD2|nr:glycosyltransferase family 4 protein [Methanobacterium sp.]MDY9922944.1 glycosyltransferase family 4 protein [Methanobacterium sp.]